MALWFGVNVHSSFCIKMRFARAAPAGAAVLSAAVGSLGYQQWQRDFALKQQDSAVEKHLPSMTEAQLTKVVRIPRLFSDEDMQKVHALQRSLADELGSASARERGQSPAAYKTGAAIEPELQPGWSITYLNTGGAFASALPELREKVLRAARRVDEANWGILQQATEPIVPRCVEYHRVTPPGSLPHLYHNDEGSALTCDVMLSEPGVDFSGGEFQTLEGDGTLVKHAFGKGDCLVFVSHKPHCVSPVKSGERRVLVIELWEGIERQCGHRCERHWMECTHGA